MSVSPGPAFTYRPRLVETLLEEYLGQLPALLVTGPRAAGKSTTLNRHAATVVRLDREADAAAFVADPDAALRDLAEPVLLDEWQNAPGVLGAVRRAVERDPRPGRFLVTGSVNAELENQIWPGTGRLTRLPMFPMTVREQVGRLDRPTFLDRLVAGDELEVPAESADLRGYVEIALRSGFPQPALQLTGRPREAWLESYIADLLTHDIEQIEGSSTRGRDTQRLRRYFEAYALNSAGLADHKTIYNAAGINHPTAAAYEDLLQRLLIAEQAPPWSSNRLKRLVQQPKRYVIDAALIAAALRMDTNGVLLDGDVLGRVLDTFVVAQLRPETTIAATRPRLHHLRTKETRQEVDVVAELAGQRLIGIEIKADSAPDRRAARHLRWLRDRSDAEFVAGVVLHTGPRVYELEDRIVAAPISVLWG
jgi:predicted AAA+ superfamily ATPase